MNTGRSQRLPIVGKRQEAVAYMPSMRLMPSPVHCSARILLSDESQLGTRVSADADPVDWMVVSLIYVNAATKLSEGGRFSAALFGLGMP